MVWHPVRAALEAGLDPVVVVTGRVGTGAHGLIESRSEEPPPAGTEPGTLRHVVNPDPERGLASSLRTGVSALGPGPSAVVILLGDMPWVRPETIRRLIEAGASAPDAACVPVRKGRRGNPVLWPRAFFEALAELTGDQGARPLLRDEGTPIREVAVDDPGIHRDVDTEADLSALLLRREGLDRTHP